MSSWATRHIPKKRDISSIPKEFRPVITTRAEQPLVIQSETFQTPIKKAWGEGGEENTKNESQIMVNPRVAAPRRIEFNKSALALELTKEGKTYVFVILRHIKTQSDNDLWISSYNSIRKLYTNKIIIIDDNSSINTVDGKLVNTEVIKSELNGAGEILPYYYLLRYKWADRMVFLHDSMFMNRPFRDSELEGQIKFHWYIDSTEIADFRKINYYLAMLKNASELQAYVTDIDARWYGCFGSASICDLATIQYLDEEYNIFKNLALHMKSRKDRETFERVFGIVLYYEGILTNSECSNFGDILKYPGAFQSENNTYEIAVNILKERGYDTAIMKVWRGR
jgi:hypothetical protein